MADVSDALATTIDQDDKLLTEMTKDIEKNISIDREDSPLHSKGKNYSLFQEEYNEFLQRRCTELELKMITNDLKDFIATEFGEKSRDFNQKCSHYEKLDVLVKDLRSRVDFLEREIGKKKRSYK